MNEVAQLRTPLWEPRRSGMAPTPGPSLCLLRVGVLKLPSKESVIASQNGVYIDIYVPPDVFLYLYLYL